MPYNAAEHTKKFDAEELRRRIPGWGVDSDPADRPSVPQERIDPDGTGAHWRFPPRQPPKGRRERSVEHEMLTPVFGTAQPLHGASGVIRRYAYDHYSEGRTAHWLLLILGDRVDAVGSHVSAIMHGHPGNPISETGIRSEAGHHPFASRYGTGRADVKHTWLDPIIVVGPWLLAVAVTARLLARTLKR